MDQCYVCFEDCTVLSPCHCKGLYLHDNCLETLRLYHHKHCRICKEEYPEWENPVSDDESESDDEELVGCCCINYWWLVPFCWRPIPYRGQSDLMQEIMYASLYTYMISCITRAADSAPRWWETDEIFLWYSFAIYIAMCSIASCICSQNYKARTDEIV
jgi:hypothetical protein